MYWRRWRKKKLENSLGVGHAGIVSRPKFTGLEIMCLKFLTYLTSLIYSNPSHSLIFGTNSHNLSKPDKLKRLKVILNQFIPILA